MATAGVAPGLSRKLKKVLESRTDSPDLLASLNTLSTFYTENTPQARRNLRSTIEKRCLSINHDFLRASDAAQLALDCVEQEVNALADCCDRLMFTPFNSLERCFVVVINVSWLRFAVAIDMDISVILEVTKWSLIGFLLQFWCMSGSGIKLSSCSFKLFGSFLSIS